jgi:predicted AlkP superfamily pyrophosphatase or phosphodiesterase
VSIQGIRPTFWKKFDSTVSSARTRQAIEWLDCRASAVGRHAYQEIVDHAGHESGPDSAEVAAAAAELDRELAKLVDAVGRLGLAARTTIVVVSDHGMAALAPHRVIWLDDYIDVADVEVTEWEGLLELRPRVDTPDNLRRVHARLQNAHPRLRVFTRDELPPRLHHADNPRTPPLIAMPDLGWVVNA